MASPFVHLHTHSFYSPMSGVPTLEALCQAARAQDQDTLALTDTNGLYGDESGIPAARHRGRSSDQLSGRNNSPSSRVWNSSAA